jgi:hypothetical protein
MSVFGNLVFGALSGDATVVALVSTRIYPNKMPEGPRPAGFKAIVFSVISDVPTNAVTGSAANRLRAARVQVDCYAKEYDDAEAVAEAVDAVMTAPAGLAGWREVSRDLYDDEAELHRVSMDIDLWA